MKNLLSILAFAILSVTVFAQTPANGSGKTQADRMKIGRLYGKIIDSTNNKAVEFASVQLLGSVFDTITKQMKQDVVVAGQLTMENGDFSLEKINLMGKYKLKISSMGYNTKEMPVSFNVDMEKMKSGGGMPNTDKDLGNIKISISATELKAVEVVGSAPAMELKLDKKVFNVEKNLVATGGTAEDVLKQVPSVSVDVEGNVSVRNASPQIFVDGKPTTLTIDQIPADAIKSIEVITNPSAKYDASGGQGGILNIVLKKDKRVGYNGNIRAGVDQRGRVNGGTDINARDGKVNIFLSGNFNQRRSISTGNTNRDNLTGSPLTNVYQNIYNINDGRFLHSRGGIDWFINNRNTLTISGNYINGKFEPTDSLFTQTDSIFLFPSKPINSSFYYRQSENFRKFNNIGSSLQYKHLFPKEGRELTADINFNRTHLKAGGDFSTIYTNAFKQPTGSSVFQNSKTTANTQVITVQSDYVHPLSEKSKIEAGIMGTYRTFSSKINNYIKNDSTGEFISIKNQNTNYTFTDQVYAAYATYGIQKGKISYQLGLRTESSFYTGELIDSNKTFKNYFPVSLFPSVSSTYAINAKDNLQFSFARRIKRPAFLQLLPFTDYSDSLNLTRGNAKLKPEFTNSLELSYLKVLNPQNNILLTAYLKNSTGLITNYQASEYDTVLKRNAIINTYENANASYAYGGEITSKHSYKWIELSVNVNAYYSIINAENIKKDLKNEQFSWFTKGTLTIKFPYNISLQISPEYRSKAALPMGGGGPGRGGWFGGSIATVQGYENPRYSVDAAIQYEFMKNKAARLSLSVRDIFATDINKTISNSEYFTQTSSRLRDQQLFRLNFSYRFGKFDASLFKRKNNKVNSDGGI